MLKELPTTFRIFWPLSLGLGSTKSKVEQHMALALFEWPALNMYL